ncbi:mycothiol conjugate amidase Mca [Lapillicoccus sp.]|uniref:mycothiol conjugate amidase Mca n=1 Tax=Lapillicoccus sp. TaxID=1909287 RepID=UPI0025DBE0B1|nr:mycothiol conjugate amidase Mca [Lapillicoccus sp.]
MPVQAQGLRLMAVHAHPDDESSKGAATTAMYVEAGAEVMVVSCTGGERGDILNPRLKEDSHILRDLAQVRRDEMAAARAILGCGHTWLGFVDSGLPEGDPLPPLPEGCFALEPAEVTTEALVRVIREVRPHVITTYDEQGGYPHPDHVTCHVVTMAAFAAAGDPAAYPHAGAPWQPLKVYYNHTFTRSRVEAFHNAMLETGLDSPYADWLKDWKRGERRITTRVPCGDFFAVRDRALMAHATQVDPDGAWFKVPLELQQRVWPTEDYELALSHLPFVEGEDDLFAGIGAPAEADALATSGSLRIAYDGRTTAPPESPEGEAD